jgi:hypothetical protein
MDTMNRCTHAPAGALLAAPARPAGLLLALALAVSPLAQAEALPRAFPDTALRGQMTVTQPPEVTLDGQPARLSPGSRIRNVNNTLALSGTLVGQELTVNYTRDGYGLVHEVWILSPHEIAQKRRSAAH